MNLVLSDNTYEHYFDNILNNKIVKTLNIKRMYLWFDLIFKFKNQNVLPVVYYIMLSILFDIEPNVTVLLYLTVIYAIKLFYSLTLPSLYTS